MRLHHISTMHRRCSPAMARHGRSAMHGHRASAMRPLPPIRLLLAAALALLTTACARGVAVQSEPGPAYAIQIDNPMSHPMIVSYDDGTGSHLLGTVSAGTQGRFVITRPASQNLTIIATDEARTHTVTRAVTVQQGVTTEVSLTP